MSEENNFFDKLHKKMTKTFTINEKQIDVYTVISLKFMKYFGEIKDSIEDTKEIFCELLYHVLDDKSKKKISLSELKELEDSKLIEIADEFVKSSETMKDVFKDKEKDENYFDVFIYGLEEENRKSYEQLKETLGKIKGKIQMPKFPKELFKTKEINFPNINIPKNYKPATFKNPLFEYNKPSNKPFDDVLSEKTKEIEEKYQNKFVVDDNTKCEICQQEIEGNFNWYHIVDKRDSKNSKVICSLYCLKEFGENFEGDINKYNIIEKSRCSAYYKCRDISNLRKMCERTETLTEPKSALISNIHNFCEPAQAGTVLATHKISQILDDFSEESNKQFRITKWMTILVIILTALNLVPIIKGFFINENQIEQDILKELKTNIPNTSRSINNNLESIESSLEDQKIVLFNLEEGVQQLNNLNVQDSNE
ncbi:hypothetical protein [Halanaerobium congolense]|uniref:Uncharacterized protein n=1 Tax=Halanaerobium congolense TaxID=54121 RepID=A0A1G6MAN4_9FIRM|nr:hypothetical protein [Halanaerobium congolense]PXV62163.1 hypothetical protein C8C78_1373 [Halanaerobium congolense]PXV62166.1 hypothetical protein C8C78_1376 [Halanaerobium congolense]SDC52573.1 hypothetical protein SAMN04488597_1085 [Halanaerobium congolense]SDL06157.1 hypothetical protein SAMN04515655_1605 [Halanaerobium congolense]SDN16385.1 hypothetical protein SAMN04488599_1631 [Halanaerobium congolense]